MNNKWYWIKYEHETLNALIFESQVFSQITNNNYQ